MKRRDDVEMDIRRLQHRETLIREVLLSGLDAQEAARIAGSPMLTYLTSLVVQCAREEIDDLVVARRRILADGSTSPNDETAA